MKFSITLCKHFLLLLALTVSGSSLATVNSVFVQSTLDYNAILISGVDVIFLYDEALVDSMPQTKSAWFSGKQAFLEEAGEAAKIVSVFIPQGFDSEMMSLPQDRDQAVRTFVYAEHDSSDRAPVDVSGWTDVLIEIDQFGIIVTPRD